MQIRCVDLPGIGRKYTAHLAEGRVLVVVLHHGGHRDIYLLGDVEAEEALWTRSRHWKNSAEGQKDA